MKPETPEGLSSIALHAMRRAHLGQRVEDARWNSGTMGQARSALLAGGWMEERRSPKGRIRWLVLTDKGRALMPEVLRYWAEQEAESRRHSEERDREERVRNAAPKMLAALHGIVDWYASLPEPGLVPKSLEAGSRVREAREIIKEVEG